MSYDIYLKDPVTGKAAEVPGHLMLGGTYRADYHPESRTFTPALNTEASLNITYNYGHYYYEIYEKDGIRAIYGVSGFDSILMLEKMIAFLNEKYQKKGEWIRTKRNKTIYYDENGNEIDGIVALINRNESVREEEVEYEVSEGDTSDYWMDTAANAIRPLHQLIALAKMRPDCIWDGD
ncbi:MAG: hypothetical protein HDR24_06960 [Lachnospiraceae bacterium]|nr:hypothetical protein [Clostridiales bacterium]MBD5462783.1 hypothetical protein [Lachnospiraceae bacterium]MDE7445251.1 hypothetical protein [Lachnospiraceae bacterium]